MLDPTEFDPHYLPGLENRTIRYYFYITKGLDVLNLFRNLFLAIFALYFALRLDNWLYLIAIFIPCVMILMVVGYYATHKANKIIDWLSIRFGTTYGLNQYKLQQQTLQELKEIKEKL